VVRVLGLESSCDETAAAVVDDATVIRSSVIASQTDLHARFGGIVPELACRAHVEQVDVVVRAALADAGATLASCDAIAVTTEPGLLGALLVGLNAAKGLALAAGKPLVAVNHLEAHVCAALLDPAAPDGAPRERFPAVALVVSGGHTVLFDSRSPLDHRLIGSTTDDAAGEAFDKAAALLGLGYPGGPAIERVARDGDPGAVDLPRSLLGRDSLDFSFSGLKTALLYAAQGTSAGRTGPLALPPRRVADLAASFQAAVVEVCVAKARRALAHTGATRLIVSGGVACNGPLRAAMRAMADAAGVDLRVPPPRLCTDNAAMVAALGTHRLAAGLVAPLDADASARPVRNRDWQAARARKAGVS
jgi:N6-L-threonylcarbamoyladenine synthase